MVDRHRLRLLCKLDREPGLHCPAHHGARIKVEDHGQMAPPFHGPDVGDASGPDPVGRVRVNWRLSRFAATGPR